MDKWFWETASDTAKNNYLNTFEYLAQKIDATHGINNDIRNGFSAHRTRYYKL
jgi:hypothetical protein